MIQCGSRLWSGDRIALHAASITRHGYVRNCRRLCKRLKQIVELDVRIRIVSHLEHAEGRTRWQRMFIGPTLPGGVFPAS